MSEACAEYVLIYLKQARDEIAMNICNLNRPVRNTVKKTLKSMISDVGKLDFTEIPEES